MRAGHILSAMLFLVVASANAQQPAAPDPSPVPAQTARSKALELAGAFSNDGYKIRDGYWAGTLEPGKPQFLEVNLFAGNEYWFSVAGLPPARKISVDLFDAEGNKLETETYADGATAAAGLVPVRTGPYTVRVVLEDGEKADFCLVYSYK